MTVVVSSVGATDAAKEVVSNSMESYTVSGSGDARDGLAGVVFG